MVRKLDRILFSAFDELRLRLCCRLRSLVDFFRNLVGLFFRNLVDGNTGGLVELVCGLLVEFIFGLLVEFVRRLGSIRQRMCAGIRHSADLIRTNGSLSFLLV